MIGLRETFVEEGKFALSTISEGEGRSLTFSPPLWVEWSVYREDDPSGPLTTAYITFDFGMRYQINLVATKNGGWHYSEISKDSTNVEVINAVVKFDLFHAFCHTSLDPNYGTLHWALYGNLKDRTTVEDD